METSQVISSQNIQENKLQNQPVGENMEEKTSRRFGEFVAGRTNVLLVICNWR